MRYFLLRQDRSPALWDALFVDGVSLHALRMGLPMTVPAPPARVSLSPAGREPSDFLELPCPIVSDAMRDALDESGVDNVEYIRAEVDFAYSGRWAVGSCWLANVVGAVACAQSLGAEEVRERAARGVASGSSPGFVIDPARVRLLPVPTRREPGPDRRECARG